MLLKIECCLLLVSIYYPIPFAAPPVVISLPLAQPAGILHKSSLQHAPLLIKSSRETSDLKAQHDRTAFKNSVLNIYKLSRSDDKAAINEYETGLDTEFWRRKTLAHPAAIHRQGSATHCSFLLLLPTVISRRLPRNLL